MLIRELQKSDEKSFVLLLEEQFGEERIEACLFIALLEKRISLSLEKMRQGNILTIFVAVEADHIVGYITIQWLQELWTDTCEAFISNLYVYNKMRKQGIGSSLLNAAIQESKKLKCARLFLENSRDNQIYQSMFYTKRGWKERQDIAIMEFPLKN